MVFRSRWLAALAASWGMLAACSSTPPDDCRKAQAAFHVVITASDGALPADTVLRVTYGGVTEEYDLASPPTQPEVVYCTQLFGDGGVPEGGADAGAGGVTSLVCDLWTQAAAHVDIDATGYPKLSQDLAPKTDDCGIVTVDYPLMLDRGDGG